MLLSVIIPVYNEVDTIGKVLEEVKATSVPKDFKQREHKASLVPGK